MQEINYTAPLTYFDRLSHYLSNQQQPKDVKYFYVQEDLWSLVEKVSTYAAFFGFVAFMANAFPVSVAFIGTVSCLIMARKIAQVSLGYLVYPRAISSLALWDKGKEFKQAVQSLESEMQSYERSAVNEVVLGRGTTRYSAVEVLFLDKNSHPSNNWEIRAFGNMMAIEDGCGDGYFSPDYVLQTAKEALSEHRNVLFVNGPGVGKSGGLPIPSQMRATFRTALEYVESKDPSHIYLQGLSLGGGMIGEALTEHTLSDKIKYMFVGERTFETLSAAAAGILHEITGVNENALSAGTSALFNALGLELHTAEGAKSLAAKGYKVIAINGSGEFGDGVLSYASRLSGKVEAEKNCKVLEEEDMDHNGPLSTKVEWYLAREKKAFFKE